MKLQVIKNHGSSQAYGFSVESGFVFGLLFLLREDIPKAEGFVTCSCNDCRSVGIHSKVEDSIGVASQGF